MSIGPITDQRPERREEQRQRKHNADQRGRHVQLNDHNTVQRSDEQNQRHPNGELEQRQPHKPPQRQILRRDIRKRQKTRRKIRKLCQRKLSIALDHRQPRNLVLKFKIAAKAATLGFVLLNLPVAGCFRPPPPA